MVPVPIENLSFLTRPSDLKEAVSAVVPSINRDLLDPNGHDGAANLVQDIWRELRRCRSV